MSDAYLSRLHNSRCEKCGYWTAGWGCQKCGKKAREQQQEDGRAAKNSSDKKCGTGTADWGGRTYGETAREQQEEDEWVMVEKESPQHSSDEKGKGKKNDTK
ncbi:hypothetical protein SLS62_003972 [Diatrype stigma]|uniref:Uncharacterized protein n=1 Tax=Diatrype stigma TaxID=117547 RepID=A0AAN9UVA3_9PEZI